MRLTLWHISELCVMNGVNYLLDTCTLIALQKQSPESLGRFAEHKIYLSQCAISVITYMEFVGFYGVNSQTAKQLEFIAKQFYCYSLSDDVRDLTIAIRQQYKIKLPDALILATAKAHQLQLLTLDDKLAKIYKQQ